ncbi:MAG TPA: aldehyde dehydrogenase [Stenotrophomonas sp.]|nr:aldehyde dehydrogenase [Stenotrophomonas sp.]
MNAVPSTRPHATDPRSIFKPRYGNYIGGDWVAPRSGQYFDNTSPVNGQVFTEVARSNAEDVEAALDAAHAAREGWGRTPVAQRALVLNRIADRIEQNLELLAHAETWDNGKPIRETLNADLPLMVDHFRYFAGALRAQEGSLSEIDADTVAYHFHEPLGVVGQIIPWNFPLLMAAWKLAPALAAGNCVVLKPAEQTPASILVLMEVIGDLLPPGVLNVVNGFGLEAGKPLASNPRIAKIAFTGETTTGRLIMQYASQNLIPVTLELGGKSPTIILDDADADSAAALAVQAGLINSGQACVAGTRILVPESRRAEFEDALARAVKAVRSGDPQDPATQVGPMVSQRQWERVQGYIRTGLDEGARLLAGGEGRPDGLQRGWFVRPTLFTDVRNDMAVAREEIFGPVLCIIGYRDEADAVAIANDSAYGLSALVIGADAQRATAVGRQIQSGRVLVNTLQHESLAPFGGMKQSGIGRESGQWGLEAFLEPQTVMAAQ